MISADGGGERDDAAMAVSLAAGSDSDRPMDRRSRRSTSAIGTG